jgi:uncharacterized membrane protein YkoI
MKLRTTVLTLAIAMAFAGAANANAAAATADAAQATPPETTQAASAMTEADVRALLVSGGYSEINDVEFEEGTWTADAKSADGNHVEVRIDAATRKIIPDAGVATISKDAVIVKVQDAGYTNVHDVDFEGGVWKAEANDSTGKDVELKLDPNDGHILGSEQDKIQNH